MPEYKYRILPVENDLEAVENRKSCARANVGRAFLFLTIVVLTLLVIFVSISDVSFDYGFDKIDLIALSEDIRPIGSHIEELWRAYKLPKVLTYNCNAFIDNDNGVMEKYAKNGRIRLEKDVEVAMDCASIRRRVMGNNPYPKIRSFAIARNVYESYALQEAFLSFSYHPDNSYCFALSKNATSKFSKKIRRLEQCFPNIYLLNKTYEFDSAGHYQDIAHFGCLERLREKKQWSHVFFLQNDDLLLYTPEEISEISKILGDASGYYGGDEMLLSTLHSNTWLKIGGQPKIPCAFPDFVRWTHWNYESEKKCLSKKRRHGVCLVGVEYLNQLSKTNRLVANKVKMDFDFGAVMCVGEYLHKISTGARKRDIDKNFYQNLPQVRQLHEKNFKC
ncbi:unnamed protein product [Caenorhabditis auriculariae]|uniref:Uncharacterized protein n=1 Tax=Caenorhabditis auriculariae TaxID=2777116 RepID=A0A8S1HJE0_9PELO|nr:unnamed protein product [Caenorhabditis auriculariae]